MDAKIVLAQSSYEVSVVEMCDGGPNWLSEFAVIYERK